MRLIGDEIIDKLAVSAAENPRRRLNYNFHKFEEPIQRMLNVMYVDSYVIPHRHSDPDKLEIFLILKGEAMVVEFEEDGNLKSFAKISSDGPNYGVEIPPRTLHSTIPLSDPCVFYEIIRGPYDEETHKKFAPWAPKEAKEGLKYNQNLLERINGEISNS